MRLLPRDPLYRRIVVITLCLIGAALLLGVVGVFASGHYPHPQSGSGGQPAVHANTSAATTPAANGPGQSPASGPAGSTSAPTATTANCPAAVPSYVNAELTKFLLAYDSLTPNETNAQRAAQLKPLVPGPVYSTLDLTVSGPPPGTTIVPQISPATLCGQSPTGQLYVTENVVEKVVSPGQAVSYNTDETDSIWSLSGTTWQMFSFSDEVYAGVVGG